MLLANTQSELQELIDRICTTSEKYGLVLNTRKTKYMVISKTPALHEALSANGQAIERVSKFTYLGCTIDENWDHSTEIKCRIEKARTTFMQMRSMLCSKDLSLNMKKKIIQCYVHPILLYGAEAWTMSEASESRVNAFEMWMYRRVLKISWTEHVSNVEVLRRMNGQQELMTKIKERKLKYLGHVMRNNKYRLLQIIIQGKVIGRRGPGRRRISWLANLRKWFGTDSTQLFRAAASKVRIAMMIANTRNG